MNSIQQRLIIYSLVFIAVLIIPASILAQGNSLWLSAGQNRDNTRHASTESKISSTNASQLAVKWVFESGGDISATPAVDGNYVYVPDWAGNIYKIDNQTGELIWSKEISSFTGQNFNISRNTPLISGDMVIFGTQLGNPVGIGATLIALNKQTGDLLWKTQIDDHFASMVTQSAVSFGDKIFVGVASFEELFAADPNYPCCTFRGSVVALNKNTGEIIWKTYTSPDPALGFSGTAVWGSTPVIDPKRGSVYVTTGNNYTVPDEVLACVIAGGTAEDVKTCIESVAGSSDNHFDAFVAMDLNTGEIKWAQSVIPFDAWTVACFFFPPNCPDPAGPDYDFGQGPALYTTKVNGKKTELLGAGQKSGIYWSLNPDNGEIVWSTQVGPGGELGGLQWGSATDGERIYTAVSNSRFTPHLMGPGPKSGTEVKGGFWAALNAATGEVLWENAGTNEPAVPPFPPGAVAMNQGAVTIANGVMFAGALDAVGTMYAFDAISGEMLWSFESGGSVNSGAAVVNGNVYWGSGYANIIGIGTPSNKLYAFHLPLAKGSSQETDDGLTPGRFGLSQNYPNPFNPSTIISYQIPEFSFVTLKVYDVLGIEITTLINEEKSVGSYEVEFNATSLPSGIYFYQLQAGSFVETKRMMLMK